MPQMGLPARVRNTRLLFPVRECASSEVRRHVDADELARRLEALLVAVPRDAGRRVELGWQQLWHDAPPIGMGLRATNDAGSITSSCRPYSSETNTLRAAGA